MSKGLSPRGTLGVVKPLLDAHTLGIGSLSGLLANCGARVVVADESVSGAFGPARDADALAASLRAWVSRERVEAIGFSWRLDPEGAASRFALLVEALRRARLLASDSGPVRALYFAGLPPACELVRERFPFVDGTFRGDETPTETLAILGIDAKSLPAGLADGMSYDEDRLAFGRDLVRGGRWESVRAPERSYPGFGARGDGIVARVDYLKARGLGPALRAHAGPWLPDRREAVALFLRWSAELAASGQLDVLSVGSSQLTQERFGEDWGDAPNGGGVPIATEEEFAAVWRAARPMLVRAYSGTTNVERVAKALERSIDIAWHALSLWWFCRLDGRGPNGVRDNLEEHFAAMRYAASSGKPVEPNVPHHFAFRGADDVSYVVSGYVAARAAKECGVRTLVLQTMLNTPRHTHGLQDLAKARALLLLARGLEDGRFRVLLQPRGGLDYFSPEEEKAKAQLAAVTALMDDIEADDPSSPDIVHVVSWSEGMRLADPVVIDESAKITRAALSEWRKVKREGAWNAGRAEEAEWRTRKLLDEARAIIAALETRVPDAWTPAGLHRMLKEGWFALPWLSEQRDEYPEAAAWRTAAVDGGVAVVDADGRVVGARERVETILARRTNGPLEG